MSGSAQKPVKINLVPFQQEQVATNQQAIPLPYLGGTRVVAVRWMTPAMNEITQPSKSSGKKGG